MSALASCLLNSSFRNLDIDRIIIIRLLHTYQQFHWSFINFFSNLVSHFHIETSEQAQIFLNLLALHGIFALHHTLLTARIHCNKRSLRYLSRQPIIFHFGRLEFLTNVGFSVGVSIIIAIFYRPDILVQNVAISGEKCCRRSRRARPDSRRLVGACRSPVWGAEGAGGERRALSE